MYGWIYWTSFLVILDQLFRFSCYGTFIRFWSKTQNFNILGVKSIFLCFWKWRKVIFRMCLWSIFLFRGDLADILGYWRGILRKMMIKGVWIYGLLRIYVEKDESFRCLASGFRDTYPIWLLESQDSIKNWHEDSHSSLCGRHAYLYHILRLPIKKARFDTKSQTND